MALYETTPKWHGFLMNKLAALAAGNRAEHRTAEYRISNRRISKDGFAVRRSPKLWTKLIKRATKEAKSMGCTVEFWTKYFVQTLAL